MTLDIKSASTKVRSVSIVGVGAMGLPIALKIISAGFDVLVCDKNTSALKRCVSAGGKIAATASDCAGSDLVLVLVATYEQLSDVVFGDIGLLVGWRAREDSDRSLILAVMSTVPPVAMKSLNLRLAAERIVVIDSPISGGVLRAENGDLTVMTGGEISAIKSVEPVYKSFSKHRFHCGDVGSAQTMKIINNLIGITNAMVAGEAYRLAAEHGLNVADVSSVLEVSTGRNFLSENLMGPSEAFVSMAPNAEAFASLSAIMQKDLKLAVDLADGSAAQFPITRGLSQLVGSLGQETFDNWSLVGRKISSKCEGEPNNAPK